MAHEGQAGRAENAEFRLHLNHALSEIRSHHDISHLTPDYFYRRFRAPLWRRSKDMAENGARAAHGTSAVRNTLTIQEISQSLTFKVKDV